MTYLLSSEIIHMITVSFDDVRRWRSLRTLALMDGDRGLAPKSGHSISSGSDSIPLMGMGPGSSGMMPLSSMPWWICLALRRTRSVASEVKLPGSETVDGWGEVERKGGSEKGEREEERREQGRIEWGEITYKISFSLFPLTLISPGLIPTLPRNHTFMIVYSILLISKMHGHCIVYRMLFSEPRSWKHPTAFCCTTSDTQEWRQCVASNNDDVTFSCWARRCMRAGHKTDVCLTKRPKLAEKWSGKQSQVNSPKVVKTNEHFP